MGKIICKIHGGVVGSVEVCAHVAAQIDAREVPAGRRFRILGTLFVCDACFAALGFDQLQDLIDLPIDQISKVPDERWAAFETVYDRIPHRQARCPECIAVLEPSRAPTA